MEANYIDDSTFSVIGDRVIEFSLYRRLKMDCGSDGIKYASVTSSSYNGSNTIVNIDENILTSNLIDVLYSVVKSGEFGNLPDHNHSNNEGDGGYIAPPPMDFISLGDTPITYSGTEGQHIQSTGSGTIWAENSFLNLIDTPSDYLPGKYVRTTSSGIEFIDGIIITAPNNSEWVIRVTNSGTLYTEGL